MTLWPITTAARIAHRAWWAHFRLWRRERALRLVDWEIDDTDDALLTARRAGDMARMTEALVWLRTLHDRRLVVCDQIVALRVALDAPTLADLEYVSAWADRRPMLGMSAAEADAEVRRIRSL